MRPPIKVMFSEVYLGKVLNFSLAFQKPLEPTCNELSRCLIKFDCYIEEERERKGWRVRDTEETKRKEARERERERDERKCERRGRKVERLLFIQ